MSRLAELLKTTPICLLHATILMLLAFMWTSQQHLDHKFTMCPSAIIFQHEYYRIITSSFLHGSVLHLASNMMAFHSIGATLEESFGTIWHFSTILSSVVMVNCTYIVIAFLQYYLAFGIGGINQHAVGFSGTLFHFLIIQCQLSSNAVHSVFGMFQVSSKFYPWVLLVGIQIIFPHVSFLGHFSGIVVGQMHVKGMLNCILPSMQRLRAMDDSRMVQRISHHENYIKTPVSNDLFDSTFSSSNGLVSMEGLRMAIVTYGNVICNCFRNILETLKVMIFGRGRELNSNIRLDDPTFIGVGDEDDIGEGDEWVGSQNSANATAQKESDYV